MLALLMCGGKGERFKIGEKPLFKVCGITLVEHSLRELMNYEVIAVTSPYTPKTEEFLRTLGIDVYRARGRGYIEDYKEVVLELSIVEPILIISSDLVYLRRNLIDEVVQFYFRCDSKALSVVNSKGPVGINIIDAFFIYEEQDEEVYRIEDHDVINVNTLTDAKRAEILCSTSREKCSQRD